MITFEIGTYSVMAYMGTNPLVLVYMRDDTNAYRGYMDFRENFSGPPYTLHANGIINAHMPLTMLDTVLETLRVEKPVYFSVNDAYNWAAIRTGEEPTGEEEGP